MNTHYRIFILIPIVIFFTACEYFLPFPNPVPNPSAEDCQPLIVSSVLYDAAPDDPYRIDTAYIKNDCVHINATYGGGCGNAYFSLHFSGAIMKSLPPQAVLKLGLKDEDDCEALVRKELSFNLSHFKGDGGKEGSIILHLEGYEESLLYEW